MASEHKESHSEEENHRGLFIHGVMSAREAKALEELDMRILSIQEEMKLTNSTRTQELFAEWTQEKSAELYEEYVAGCSCCHDTSHCTEIRQALIVKDYEKARPLIASNAEHLPECVQLLVDYDFLKSQSL